MTLGDSTALLPSAKAMCLGLLLLNTGLWYTIVMSIATGTITSTASRPDEALELPAGQAPRPVRTCKCGAPVLNKASRCKDCNREYMRAYQAARKFNNVSTDVRIDADNPNNVTEPNNPANQPANNPPGYVTVEVINNATTVFEQATGPAAIDEPAGASLGSHPPGTDPSGAPVGYTSLMPWDAHQALILVGLQSSGNKDADPRLLTPAAWDAVSEELWVTRYYGHDDVGQAGMRLALALASLARLRAS